VDSEDEGKTCAWCNKETMLALFGVALGVLFIALSLDTLRRMRMPSIVDGVVEGTVAEND
jgi:hypothetical protein